MQHRVSRGGQIALVSVVVGASVLVVACGSPAAKSASTPAAAGTVAGDARGARGFGNRTVSPDIQTSIAEGTPRPGRGTAPPDVQTSVAQGTPFPFRGTPSSDIQTSVAEGTPFPFRGMPPPDAQTAIAEGTPRAGGPGGRVRLLGLLASVLNVPASQLQTELQASGATVASVAAAHGHQRAALSQALVQGFEQRTAQQVQSGVLTQDAANQANSQFASSIDMLLDGNSLDQPAAPGQ